MRTRFLISLLSAAIVANSTMAAEIDVTSWVLRSRVTANDIGSAIDGTNTVQNPFHKVDHAELPSPGGATSTADAEYFASWDSDGFLSFILHGEHTAAGNPALFSRSTGTIYVTPQVDSVLTIDIEYNYSLASGIRQAFIDTGVGEVGGDVLLYYADSANNLVDPPDGQLTFESGEIFLSAGLQYAIAYRLELNSFGGSPSLLSHCDGTVEIDISPVPEPATLALFAIAFPFILRPRRR